MPASTLSLGRKLAFAAILIVVTVSLLLGSLEAALRLAGYGYSSHFARLVTLPGGETIWRENRWATAPFFSAELVRRPQPFRLSAKKTPGTFRIFVLGSSAAMGDPEPSFSIARMLETMLRAAYPGRRIEVINAAVTAINSHVARGIADDCAQLEPDLFVVYEGHNEVIGPFGPSGVFTPFLRSEAAIRAAVWTKGTRTGQLVSAAARRIAGQKGAPADWGGMQMFVQQQIAADDPRLVAVRAHFRSNLLAIAAAGERVGAATLICTVLTNQRDFAPFLSLHRKGLTNGELVQWTKLVDSGEAAQRRGALAAAESAYRAALAIDDQHAETVFRLGRLLLQNGRDAEGRPLLQRALDLDALRFRTDASLNQAIRDLPAIEAAADLTVVDLAKDLATRSAHGLIGDDLLYEHVHLTFHGAYEVARGLFQPVVQHLASRGLGAPADSGPIAESEARLRLGYTMHEQAMIALELLNRFRRPPFSGQADHAYRLQSWERRAQTANALLNRPDALPTLREIYRQALALSPDDWVLARNAGSMFVARHAPAEALPLLERAAAPIDDDIDTLVALGWAHRELGHAAKADAVFAKARQLEPNYPGLPKP